MRRIQVRTGAAMFNVFLLSGLLMCGCGDSSFSSSGTPQAVAPTIATSPSQNGAMIVALKSSTPGATIYYTLDNSAPTTSAQRYEAPFLVAANLTVKTIATAPGNTASSVTTQAFAPNIPMGTLVWSDEFNSTGSKSQPNPLIWTYDTGNSGFGNHELENYCAWG